jgi:hypothetical protein
VSFQKLEFVSRAEMPNMGTGTSYCFHCTVGCTPTCEMLVIITSSFSPPILLKIGAVALV